MVELKLDVIERRERTEEVLMDEDENEAGELRRRVVEGRDSDSDLGLDSSRLFLEGVKRRRADGRKVVVVEGERKRRKRRREGKGYIGATRREEEVVGGGRSLLRMDGEERVGRAILFVVVVVVVVDRKEDNDLARVDSSKTRWRARRDVELDRSFLPHLLFLVAYHPPLRIHSHSHSSLVLPNSLVVVGRLSFVERDLLLLLKRSLSKRRKIEVEVEGRSEGCKRW